MNEITDADNRACLTPIEEHLRSIPIMAVYNYTEITGVKASVHIPIGNIAHEAASYISDLQRQLLELTERLAARESDIAAVSKWIASEPVQNIINQMASLSISHPHLAIGVADELRRLAAERRAIKQEGK